MTSWPPARIRPLVSDSWGWFPLLTVVAGASALLLATAFNLVRLNIEAGGVLYWIAYPLGVVPVVAVLLLPDRARRERIALVALLGVEMFWPTLLRSPTSFGGYDDLLHIRSLEDILRIGHLFQPNPLLTVGPYFPGLETVTTAIAQVSGADPFSCAIVLLGFFVVRRQGLVWPALTAWLAGTLLSLLFVNYPNIYPGVHAFNQPLIDLLRGADLSGLVSVAVAAGTYAGLVRVVSR